MYKFLFLAVIISIILLLLSLVLFSPTHYRIDGVKNTQTKEEELKLEFSWLFRTLYGYAIYKDKGLTSGTFLLGKRLTPKMRWRNIKVVKYVEENDFGPLDQEYMITDCFSEYIEEHAFCFVNPADENEGTDCEF